MTGSISGMAKLKAVLNKLQKLGIISSLLSFVFDDDSLERPRPSSILSLILKLIKPFIPSYGTIVEQPS